MSKHCASCEVCHESFNSQSTCVDLFGLPRKVVRQVMAFLGELSQLEPHEVFHEAAVVRIAGGAQLQEGLHVQIWRKHQASNAWQSQMFAITTMGDYAHLSLKHKYKK